MSYTSIINMIDKNKKRTTYQPRKRNIKKTALYDNQLARSFVRLSRCRTSSQCFALANEAADEFRALEFMHKMTTEDYRDRRLRINNMKAFSMEAASYLYSLEEENKTENWFTKALNFFKEMFKKLIVKVAAIIKGIQVKIAFFIASFSNKIYRKFDKSKFVNMGAKIKVTPIGTSAMGGAPIDGSILDPTKNKTLKDIFSQVPTIIQEMMGVSGKCMDKFDDVVEKAKAKMAETYANTQFGSTPTPPESGAETGFMNLEFDMSDPDEAMYLLVKGLQTIKSLGKDLCQAFKVEGEGKLSDPRKIAMQLIYQKDERPKSIETTVGEYLGAIPGTTPVALICLSEPSLKTLQMANKIAVGLINGLKKNIGALEKTAKAFDKRLRKEKLTGLSKVTKIAIQMLNTVKGFASPIIIIIQIITLELLHLRGNIAKAIVAGSKGAASQPGQSNAGAAAPNQAPAGE